MYYRKSDYSRVKQLLALSSRELHTSRASYQRQVDALDRMRWFGEEKQALSDALLALEVKREKRTVWGVSYTCLDKRCVDAVLHPFCASRHIANEEALRASLLKECDLVEERVESDV